VLNDLHASLRRELARAVRYRHPIALLLLDLPPSSEVLRLVRDVVRLCDSAAPAPGNRVAVILPETTLGGALLVATRLAGTLTGSLATGGPHSVGVAAYPTSNIGDVVGLARAAEKAMENARSRGGGIMTATSS
jgi:GGDEF domain-containing protein